MKKNKIPVDLNTQTDQAGFTLIEVLIAIAIFSIGLMAMGALQASSLMQTGDIGRKTEAMSVLEQQLDTLKAMPFGEDDLDEGDHNQASAEGRYDIHWSVADLAPEEIPWEAAGTNRVVSKSITVAVTRTGGDVDADSLMTVNFFKTRF